MNQKTLIIIILLMTAVCCSAIESQQFRQINQQAIQAYHSKDYDQALEKFTQLEFNGIINADLFYNIGNCYFRKSQLGRAILYYKKALKIDPSHAQAASNLKFMQTLIKDKIESQDKGALLELLESIYKSIDMNSAALFTAILFACLIILIILLQTVFADRDKSLPVFLIIIIIILLSASSIIAYLKYDNFNSRDEAVITAQTAIGYSGPGEEYTRVFTIHEGLSCQIEDQKDNWLLIKLDNGIGGWIDASLLNRVVVIPE